MAYPVRRQIYRSRVGPLRYWMLAHSYLGVIAGIARLMHGGTQSGGILTALMTSFDLVVLTGLFGILCHYFVPRLLTRMEGQPLLIDDLTTRREELGEEIRASVATVSVPVRELIERSVVPQFLSIGALLRRTFRFPDGWRNRFFSHFLACPLPASPGVENARDNNHACASVCATSASAVAYPDTA